MFAFFQSCVRLQSPHILRYQLHKSVTFIRIWSCRNHNGCAVRERNDQHTEQIVHFYWPRASVTHASEQSLWSEPLNLKVSWFVKSDCSLPQIIHRRRGCSDQGADGYRTDASWICNLLKSFPTTANKRFVYCAPYSQSLEPSLVKTVPAREARRSAVSSERLCVTRQELIGDWELAQSVA